MERLFGHTASHEGLIVEFKEVPPPVLGYAHFTLSSEQVEEWAAASRLVTIPANGNAWMMPEFLAIRRMHEPANAEGWSPTQTSPIELPTAEPSACQRELYHWPEVLHAPEIPEMRKLLMEFGVPDPSWRTAHCSTTSCAYLAIGMAKVYAISYERAPTRWAALGKIFASLSCTRSFSRSRYSRSSFRDSLATTASSATFDSHEKSSVAR